MDPDNPDAMIPLSPGKTFPLTIHVLQLETEDPNAYDHPSDDELEALMNFYVLTPWFEIGWIYAGSWLAWFFNEYDYWLPF